MRIFISALRFSLGRTLGAQTYFASILRAVDEAEGDREVVVAGSPDLCSWINGIAPGVETLAVAIPGSAIARTVHEAIVAPRLVRRARADVVFFPFNFMPRVNTPSVLFVHDLVQRFYLSRIPGFRPVYNRLAFHLLRRSISRADLVACPTRAIAAEIASTGWIAADNVTPIPEASMESPEVKIRPTCESLDRTFLLLQPGSHLPHKSHVTGVLALARLRSLAPEIFGDTQLVITGSDRSAYSDLEDLARKLGVEAHLLVLGRLPQPELEWLMEKSACMVFPTLYEGFGLGVVEAQRRGKAVIASDIPVLREVSGGIAEFFPPGDPDGLAEAIIRLLADGQRRATMERAGATHASRWTWADHAQDLLQLLDKVAQT